MSIQKEIQPYILQAKVKQHTGELQQLLDETKTADILGVTNGTLQVWRCTSRYNLPYVKIGRLVKYRLSDILAFIESRTQNRIEG